MAKIGQGPSTPAMTFQDPMVDKLGNAEAKTIHCPVIRTLINEDLITPDENGLVNTEQLNDALKSIGVGLLPRKALVAGVPKVEENKGLLSRLFNRSEQHFNVYDLFNGPIDHKADTQSLRGGFNQERFDLLKSFSADGESMTIADLDRAQEFYLTEEPGLRGSVIGKAELTALLLVFGKPNADGDRALSFDALESLFKENELPEGFEPQNVGMLKLLGGMANMAFTNNSTTATGRSQMGLAKALDNAEGVDQSSIKGLGAALCPVGMQPVNVQSGDGASAFSESQVAAAHSQMGVGVDESAAAE